MTFPADCARRYQPVEKLAQGGFGTVWRATQAGLDRPVAIKLLDAQGDEQAIARFSREARVTAMLEHPHVVRLLDHGCETGAAWIALEFVEGASLRRRVDRGPIEPALALEIAAQVADALACAHAAGVLHRDVKPENVLESTATHFKVTDFGIATWTAKETSIQTAAGVVLGTPAYLAPEQIDGVGASPASDLYSLGCMLHELLTGRPPFVAAGLSTILDMHMKKPPAPAGVSPAVDRLVLQLLAKTPAERPSSATEVRDALRTAASSVENVPARPARVTARQRVGSPGSNATAPASFAGRSTQVSAIEKPTPSRRTAVLIAFVGLAVVGVSVRALLLRPAPPPPPPPPSVHATPSAAAPEVDTGTYEAPWLGTPLQPLAAELEAILASRAAAVEAEKHEKWLGKLAVLTGTAIGEFANESADADEIVRNSERIFALQRPDLEAAQRLSERAARDISILSPRPALALRATTQGVYLVLWHQAMLLESRLAEAHKKSPRRPYQDQHIGNRTFAAFADLMVRILRGMPQALTHADARFVSECFAIAIYLGRAIEYSDGNARMLDGAKASFAQLDQLAQTDEVAKLVGEFFRAFAGRQPDGTIKLPMEAEARGIRKSCEDRIVALRARTPDLQHLIAKLNRINAATRR